jgi:hypothetical protein
MSTLTGILDDDIPNLATPTLDLATADVAAYTNEMQRLSDTMTQLRAISTGLDLVDVNKDIVEGTLAWTAMNKVIEDYNTKLQASAKEGETVDLMTVDKFNAMNKADKIRFLADRQVDNLLN